MEKELGKTKTREKEDDQQKKVDPLNPDDLFGDEIEEEGKIDFSSFYVKVLGIKGCVDEGSTLDIIFENGEKTQLVNWKDFDCDGKNYFRLPKGKLDLFKSSSIKGYKYTNKRNYDTMISKDNLDDKGKNYLKNTLLEIDKINSGEVVVGMCKD